ncbi:MAG: hypothetical protein ACRENB_03185 [Gemmatimonadales bacterium]
MMFGTLVVLAIVALQGAPAPKAKAPPRSSPPPATAKAPPKTVKPLAPPPRPVGEPQLKRRKPPLG